MAQCSTCTSKTVIRKLKTHFARYGIPDILYSDNGPQYSSDEFRSFRYPQSNGKVESAVKTAKRLMAKAKRAGADPYLAMLDHRNTPSQGTDSSPAMMLMGRRTKTLLIMRENLLRQGMAKCQLEKFKERQQKQAKYYDTSAKDLTELQRYDRVRVQPLTGQKQWWQRATVVRPVEQRSYEVKTEQEQVFRRNRRHLRKSREIEEDFPTVEEPGTEPLPLIGNHYPNIEIHTIELKKPNTKTKLNTPA
uniref:Integrase catalytic domain-containing protein n=1 Tax=Hucho hucho TaxID=62062 RepID=A0A4W5KKQ3_9TELE